MSGTVLPPPPIAPLNDTGIVWWAADILGFVRRVSTEPPNYPGQDASYGCDHGAADDADGRAGFSFSKLDSVGNELPANAPAWDCVRDNVTGLWWENKTHDGGLRDVSWTYAWYNPELSTNGGYAGYRLPRTPGFTDNCDPSLEYCSTLDFINAVNSGGLCGYTDWRLPTTDELHSLYDYNDVENGGGPVLDVNYFSQAGRFYSSVPYVASDHEVWCGYFDTNDPLFPCSKNESSSDVGVLLVRGSHGTVADTDQDGIADVTDNCISVANAEQLDTDGDGIGNMCDCDFNQDNFCGGPDFTLFIGCFNAATGGNPTCEAADMNGDGFVGGPDYSLFIGGFNGAPGPSGL